MKRRRHSVRLKYGFVYKKNTVAETNFQRSKFVVKVRKVVYLYTNQNLKNIHNLISHDRTTLMVQMVEQFETSLHWLTFLTIFLKFSINLHIFDHTFRFAAKLLRNRGKTYTTRGLKEKFHKIFSLIFVLINS